MKIQVQSDNSPVKMPLLRKEKARPNVRSKEKSNLSCHTMGKNCNYTLVCFVKVPGLTEHNILNDF